MSKTQFTNGRQHISPKQLLGTVVALVATFIILTSVVNVAQKYFVIKRHIRELGTEQEELKKKQAKLADMNSYLATADGAEQALREKYNVIKPGEGVIMIVDIPQAPEPERQGTISRWWQSIMHGLGIHPKSSTE